MPTNQKSESLKELQNGRVRKLHEGFAVYLPCVENVQGHMVYHLIFTRAFMWWLF